MKLNKLCNQCAKIICGPNKSLPPKETYTVQMLEAYKLALNKYMNVGLEVAQLRRPSRIAKLTAEPPSSR
jgi:hypothetical protein